MKVAILVAIVLAFQGTLAVSEDSTQLNYELDVDRDFGFVLKFFARFFLPFILNGTPVDPVFFDDFKYNLSSPNTDRNYGSAEISNAVISELSSYTRRINFNLARRDFELHIKYPKLIANGQYSMEYHEGDSFDVSGQGSYQHTFTNVSFDATFTLDESLSIPNVNSSIRFTPNRFQVVFDDCSLYADNYTINGELQTNWTEISSAFKDNYHSTKRMKQNELFFGEAAATILNLHVRAVGYDANEILLMLLAAGAVITP